MEPAQVNVSLILFQNGFSSAYFLFYFSLFFSVVTMIAFKFLISTCMSKIWNIKPGYYHENRFSLCEREAYAYAYAHKVLGIDMSLTAGIRISQKASFL